jgi:hypothetical protein
MISLRRVIRKLSRARWLFAVGGTRRRIPSQEV